MTIQDIFKNFGSSFLLHNKLSYEQLKVFHDIKNCRTPNLGGHLYMCEECGFKHYSYNSCRNRHCPSCQDYKKEQWINRNVKNILNVTYFHVVLTIPNELHSIFLQNKLACYNLLFEASTNTIKSLSLDKKFLGATPGITAMLHTWNQVGQYHPHVHLIVTGGGLNYNHKWINSKHKFFIPTSIIEKKFKYNLLKGILKLDLKHFNKDLYLNDKNTFKDLIESLYSKKFLVYCKKPYKDSKALFEYIGKYAFKVFMSNERIKQVTKSTVTFEYKDTLDRNIRKLMTISGTEFIRRYLLNVLPKNFSKIRHYGLFSSRNKDSKIRTCQKQTNTTLSYKTSSTIEILNSLIGRDITLCPKCNGELYRIIKTLPPPDTKIAKKVVLA